jgi:hypothetical protein
VSNLLDVLRGTVGEIFRAKRKSAGNSQRCIGVGFPLRLQDEPRSTKTSISLITGKKARIVSPRFFRFQSIPSIK